MKQLFRFIGFMILTAIMVLSGGGYAMAAAADETEPLADLGSAGGTAV